MAVTTLNPYLSFNGTAQAAITFYERALRAKVQDLIRYRDVPGMHGAPEHAEWVVHSMLRIGPSYLMISDAPPNNPAAPPARSNFSVCVDFDDVNEMLSCFEALAAGGTITIPPHDTFYGGKLGMLVDVHGVSWMVNHSPKRG